MDFPSNGMTEFPPLMRDPVRPQLRRTEENTRNIPVGFLPLPRRPDWAVELSPLCVREPHDQIPALMDLP
jgi:hypothetical protein